MRISQLSIMKQGARLSGCQWRVFFVFFMVFAGGCAITTPIQSRQNLVNEVTEVEIAFAKTMADRNFSAFLSFVADDAVFLNGGKPLRGKLAIAAHWKGFFTEQLAPFSWRPDLVEVVGSGRLAQSIGAVTSPDGKIVARFYSTWRLEPDGSWRVVLDDGYDVCNCPAK